MGTPRTHECFLCATAFPVYIHSKVCVVDDHVLLTGSANMDNTSAFRSTELSASIHNKELARDTRLRLMEEHLQRPVPPQAAFLDVLKLAKDGAQLLRRKLAGIPQPDRSEDSCGEEMGKPSSSVDGGENFVDGEDDDDMRGRLLQLVPEEEFQFVNKVVDRYNTLDQMFLRIGFDPVAGIKELLQRYRKAWRDARPPPFRSFLYNLHLQAAL